MSVVMAITPALAAEYATVPPARTADDDDRLTIAPDPFLAITGMACFDARNTVRALMSKARCHSSSDRSTTLPNDAKPRLLTRMSRVPKVSTAASTIALQSSDLV